MDDATAKKFYGMYDNEEYIPETDYKPNINTTPQIEVDKRNYTRNTAPKKVSGNTSNQPNNNTIPNNLPNNPPTYNPAKIPGRKFSINGKSIGDFIKDVIYYNPNNPLDPGNYADAVAVAAVTSEKYARGPLEKMVVTGGVIFGGIIAKKYLYDKFVK